MKENGYTPDYFHIPALVMLNKNLQPLDSKVYGIVHWFEEMEMGICIASNATIAKFIGSTGAAVANSLVRLKNEELIYSKFDDLTGTRREWICTNLKLVKGSSNDEGGVHQMMKGGSSNDEHINKIYKENNTNTFVPEADKQLRAVYELYLKRIIIPSKLKEKIDNTPPGELLKLAEARYKLTPDRAKKIRARLKDAKYSMVCAAVVGYSKNPFYLGDNDNQWFAKLAEFICRSYDKVEEGAGKYEVWKKGKNQNDPWA